MLVFCICWDIGGIDFIIVYNCLKKYGLFCVIFIKGVLVYGKLVVNMLCKCNKNGVYFIEVGIDIVKE